MSDQETNSKTYLQKKNPDAVDLARKINLIKLGVIAFVGLIGFLYRIGDIPELFGEMKFGQTWGALLVFMLVDDTIGRIFYRSAKLWELMNNPYVIFLLLIASIVCTLLWKKSKWVVVVHGILYALMGWQFYAAWWALTEGSIIWLLSAIIMWPLTIVLFIVAWNGNRMVEVKEVEGMNSIFPEQRFSSDSGTTENER